MPVTHTYVSAAPPVVGKVDSSAWNAVHTVVIVNADVDPAAAIDESKLNLNYPTHALVTLGTASGLSLVGQVLSLGLASSGVTGALSGTDWNTFNNKQSALTFPLVSTLGGTGVNNAGTITNASNTTITGGGTLTLEGFTLTIPATGTAALLGTANVFTTQQMVDGTSDQIQLRVQGNATQTTNILTVEKSNGTVLFSVSNTPSVRIPSNGGFIESTDNAALYVARLYTDTAGIKYGTDLALDCNPATTSTATFAAVKAYSDTLIGTSANVGTLQGLFGQVQHKGSGVMTAAQGLNFVTQVLGSGGCTTSSALIIGVNTTAASAAGTGITTAQGIQISIASNGAPITTAYGIQIQPYTKSGSGSVTNVYGLYVGSQTVGATLNYAIFTNAGLNNLGDQLKIDGSQDIIQHIVQAHSTQTTNVWELQTSAAAIVNSMSLTAGAIFNEQGDAAIDFRVESDTKANMLFVDSSVNAVGINHATPTAYLHLGIGSTAAGTAPLKFTQDATSLLTAVEAGAMEYYHNSLWFTNLAVRRTVVQAQSVVLVDQTIANTTIETTIFTQNHGANYLQVGKCEEIIIQGIISSLNTGLPAANALTIRVKYAGATLGTFTVLKSATANRNYEIHMRITCRAIGNGTTTIQVHGNADVEGIATDPVFNGTSTGLDSTTAQASTVTVQWTDASASNTTTIQQGYALSIDNNA